MTIHSYLPVAGFVDVRPRRSFARLIPLTLLAVAACSTAEGHVGDPDAEYRAYFSEYARPSADSIPYPEDNAPTAARIELGKALFFDPRLSAKSAMSCASCHSPGFDWGDGNPQAVGHDMQILQRRTPTVLNLAWAAALMWDGRAATLEEQALGPIQAEVEMNMNLDEMIARLRNVQGYRPLFQAAYADEEISPASVARALAAYQRTVVSGVAPFDRWIAGETHAISEEAKRGFALFNGKAQCSSCHTGWRFTDDSFHDIGVVTSDRGRGAIIDLESIQFAFKTPTLRNVDRRGPYMHNGSEATLAEVVELYNLGGRVKRPSLSPEIDPLHLTAEEQAALVAFLRTLTSQDAAVVYPVLPR